MSKQPKKAAKVKKKYRPFRFVRIPEALAEDLEAIAEERYSTVSEQVRQAVREFVVKSKPPEPMPARPYNR